jgi:alpha-L-arabinofuranosidase
VPVLRWPGGNFVSGYHWLDGVGPAANPRPHGAGLARRGINRFGTNEFIQYCRVIGAGPYICVNMGSGTMDEAQASSVLQHGQHALGNLRPRTLSRIVHYWGPNSGCTAAGRSAA